MGANKGRVKCKTLQLAPLCAPARYSGRTLFPFIEAILSIKLRNSLTLYRNSLLMNDHDNAVLKTEWHKLCICTIVCAPYSYFIHHWRCITSAIDSVVKSSLEQLINYDFFRQAYCYTRWETASRTSIIFEELSIKKVSVLLGMMSICHYHHSGVLCQYATIITAGYYVIMPLSYSGVLCQYDTIITAGYYVNMPLSSQRGIMSICHYHHSGVLCHYATIITAGYYVNMTLSSQRGIMSICHYHTAVYYVNMPLSSQRGIMSICNYHQIGVLCQYATIITAGYYVNMPLS